MCPVNVLVTVEHLRSKGNLVLYWLSQQTAPSHEEQTEPIPLVAQQMKGGAIANKEDEDLPN